MLAPIPSARLAGWQSGYAADCKSAYIGSIPVPASRRNLLNLRLILCFCDDEFAVPHRCLCNRGVSVMAFCFSINSAIWCPITLVVQQICSPYTCAHLKIMASVLSPLMRCIIGRLTPLWISLVIAVWRTTYGVTIIGSNPTRVTALRHSSADTAVIGCSRCRASAYGTNRRGCWGRDDRSGWSRYPNAVWRRRYQRLLIN